MGEVFNRAIAEDWRHDNPAEAVKATLPRIGRGRVKHHKALDYNLVSQFIAELRQRQAWPVTKLAYEFLILTALRPCSGRGSSFPPRERAGRTQLKPNAGIERSETVRS